MKMKWVVLVAIIILGVIAYSLFHTKKKTQIKYDVAEVTRGSMELTVPAYGKAAPQNKVEVKPSVGGRIEEVFVNEGQEVKAGQTLALASTTERAALIDAARSQGPEELRAMKELYKPTTIVAPINGTLIVANQQPGQTFNQGDPVFVISNHLVIQTNVDETDIARIRIGLPARVTLDAYPQNPFEGLATHIAYDSQTVNGVINYVVDVSPKKVPPFMRSGMTATVNFLLSKKDNLLLIPAAALGEREGKYYVLSPSTNAEQAPTEHPVKVGISDGKSYEALEGVTEKEKILIPQFESVDERNAFNNPNKRKTK